MSIAQTQFTNDKNEQLYISKSIVWHVNSLMTGVSTSLEY